MEKLIGIKIQFEGDENWYDIDPKDVQSRCLLLTGNEMKFLELKKPVEKKEGDPPENKGEEIKKDASLKVSDKDNPDKEKKKEEKNPPAEEQLKTINTALEDLTKRIAKVEQIEGRTAQIIISDGKKNQGEEKITNKFWETSPVSQ